MPWSETRPMDERLRFVVEAERGEEFCRALCARYGIQPKTGYKWLERFEAEVRQAWPSGRGVRITRQQRRHARVWPR